MTDKGQYLLYPLVSCTLNYIFIGLQYISESSIIISNNLNKGDWTKDATIENWSTSVDTHSLSFCQLFGV